MFDELKLMPETLVPQKRFYGEATSNSRLAISINCYKYAYVMDRSA